MMLWKLLPVTSLKKKHEGTTMTAVTLGIMQSTHPGVLNPT